MEKKITIMIVDDEADFTESLKGVLEARSYRVIIATNKTQAQQLARNENPDTIVVSTIMPRGDAFLLHRWFKHTAEFSEVPMLVIDAPLEKQALKGWRKEEGLRLEADDYVVKPVEPASLMPLIDYLVKPVEPKSVVPLLEKMMDTETKRIKVLVVDDHAIVRDGIRALLGVQKDMHVVGEAVNGKDAVEKVRQLSPDIVLMDIVMPVMNGLEAAKQISRESEKTKVLMLSQYDDDENVLASSQAGAHGFVPKKSASTQLLSAIRSAS